MEQDVYKLDVGIRTVALAENKLYVNGRTFDLRGILRRVCQKVVDDDHYEFRMLFRKFGYVYKSSLETIMSCGGRRS